jgi:hypothetical protein
MASGKMTPRFELMVPAVCEVDDFLDGGTYKKAADQDALYKQWLGDKLAETKREVRRLLHQMAQIRFSVIVGQTWFTEFATIEETIYTLNLPKGEVQCNVEMKEVKVEI